MNPRGKFPGAARVFALRLRGFSVGDVFDYELTVLFRISQVHFDANNVATAS
jgi:hypothetical protein